MVKALLIEPSGSTRKVSIKTVADIKTLLSIESVDYDYNRNLGVYVYYEFGSTHTVNVFPSYLMQGGYRGPVVVVGDLDEKADYKRINDFRNLPKAWFKESLSLLIQRANTSAEAIALVTSNMG
jgi:hypothetical protein